MTDKQEDIIYKVFGNKERVQLICCLSKVQSVTELLQKCSLSQSALSQHLRVLKDAGMISCKREGKMQMYSVTSAKALSIAQALLRY
jgi:DNA-binding transcriptional ArsR family regulator